MTAKLVKIKDVHLYTSIRIDEETTAECEAVKKLLTDAGIPFNELWYNNPEKDEWVGVFEALGTWTWGYRGAKGQREFNKFPILHWTDCYDDWSTHVDHAVGLSEIQESSLLKNATLTRT